MKQFMSKKLNRVLALVLTIVALMTGQRAWAESSWEVTNNYGNSNTFTIKRSETGYVQKVLYRTISLSAYAGQHFTAKNGELEFLADEYEKTITVSELTPSGAYLYYKDGTTVKYGFEVTDRAGFRLAYAERKKTWGTSVPASGAFSIKDITIEASEYLNTDDGYDNNLVKSVNSSSYFSSTNTAPKAYYQLVGAELRMTLSMDVKEADDGYQYMSILNSTTLYDNRKDCSNGDPGNISNSWYMAGFEHKTGGKDESYKSYSFPVTSVDNNAGHSNPWGHGTNYILSKQKFNTNRRASDGRLLLPMDFSVIAVRCNASGNDDDDWYAKNVKAHIQAVDGTNPTKSAVSVNPGRHAKGNTVYVSVAFSEIVTVTGTPTLTTTTDNHWGSLTYVEGSGTNVLTFSTTIPQDATGSLNITGLSGTVKDLAGNSLSGGVTASNLCSVDAGDISLLSQKDSKYLITCRGDLQILSGYVNAGNNCRDKTFLQVTNLTFPHTTNWDNSSSTENNFTAIGIGGKNFKGTYNGQGYTISGIRIYKGGNSVSDSNHGIFGNISNGTVRNVHLTDTRITGWRDIGGIAGHTDNATIEDCTVGADVCIHAVMTDADYHGGIVGMNSYSTIRRCISRATLTVADGLTGINTYGGIAGVNNGTNGIISDCLAIGVTVPNVTNRGTIVGSNSETLTRNYYLNCTVAGVENATNVGTGSGDVTTNQGAQPLYLITLGTDVTINRTPATDPLPGTDNYTYANGADIAGVPYGYEGATVALGYSGEVPTGYHVEYTTTAGTINGSTLTMPAEAVTVSVGTEFSANSYSVHFDANGGSGSMSDMSFTYDAAQALTANAFTGPTGYVFSGWNTRADGNGASYTNQQEVSNLTTTQNGVFELYAQWADVWGMAGEADGTVQHPYTITTTAGLDLLATDVNNGNNYSGKHFVLGDDIAYPHTTDWDDATSEENNYTAIGTFSNEFAGIFDGDGHTVRGIRIYKAGATTADDSQGLFGLTSSATIKNVILADARITGKQFVGSIAGYLSGTVENCRVGSDVTIHAVADDAIYHGAVVGLCDGGTFFGCVSAATLTVADGLTGIRSYGGIAGIIANCTLYDCLVLGASVPAVTNFYGAIAGSVSNSTLTNCYYHDCTVGSDTNQSDAYTVSAGTDVTMALAGDADVTYPHNGIQRYDDALYYGGVIYEPTTAAGTDVSLTLNYNSSVPTYLTLGYAATAGTLTGTGNPYTLTMPNEDVTINATLSLPYIAADGTEQTCVNPTIIESSTGSTVMLGTDGEEHWFVVSGDVSITNTGDGALRFNGAARLILCDGASLTLSGSWPLTVNGNLVIYGQSQGTGSLTAEGSAAIKVYEASTAVADNGTLTINGGSITAHSTDNNCIDVYNSITVNGGTVSATIDNQYGYGILSNHGDVTVNGGTVSAIGGNRSIGIQASGTITLGWTNADDRITANSYKASGTISVKTGQTLTDGSAAYSGTVDKSAIGDKTLWPDLWDVAGGNDGSSAEKAYTITTTGGLDQLAAQVKSGSNNDIFYGKFFRLGNDITYSHTTAWNDATSEENNFTPIGSINNGSYKYFSGTFDGQGHTVRGIRIYKAGTTTADNSQGLFGLTSGATIKNVILADARITGRQEGGGIAGYLSGTVENCRVGNDVTIHAAANNAATHGGVVGICSGGTIRGCVSAATLTVASGLTGINTYGGIVGYLNGNMSDCLAIGASVPAVDNRGAIAGLVYDDPDYTHTNNYHRGCTVGGNAAPSDADNVSAYTVSAGTDVTVALAGSADATYTTSCIQRYGTALYYNGVLYAPEAANVSLTLGNTAPTELFDHYTANAGTLSGSENPYTLTMPAEDVTINAFLKVPYIDENGVEQLCADYTVIDEDLIEDTDGYLGTSGQTHWYVVKDDVHIYGTLNIEDQDTHLILCDGSTLNVSSSQQGIHIFDGSLTIYGQSLQSGTLNAGSILNNAINAESGNITINGGNISVQSNHSTAIYVESGNITINGGNVSVIGQGYCIVAGTITLGWTNATDRIYANRSYGCSTLKVKDGQTLYNGLTAFTGNITASKDDLADQTLMGVDVLQDATANDIAALATRLNGKQTNIMLYGRTLYRDGDWNTLCLPFDIKLALDMNNIRNNEDHIFHGATVMDLDPYYWRDSENQTYDVSADGRHRSGEVDASGNLYLYFSKMMSVNDFYGSAISAGTPCIVKWGTKADHPATDIVNPVFQGVTVTSTTPIDRITEEGPGNVTCRGTYSPVTLTGGNKSLLFLGSNNNLYYPATDRTIGAFRVYFELGNGLTVGDPESLVKGFNLSFCEGDEATRIEDGLTPDPSPKGEGSDGWYDLNGRKLDGKPTQKGIYINNGKKVVVK